MSENQYPPLSGQVDQVKPLLTADDEARERQDYLAGTVWADAAGLVPGPRPLFLALVTDDDHTYLPAPQIREAFALLDQLGGVEASRGVAVEPSWEILLSSAEESLVKLTLTFGGPVTGKAAIVWRAQAVAHLWRHVADGVGLICLTTRARAAKAQRLGAEGLPNLGIMIPAYESPGLRELLAFHGW